MRKLTWLILIVPLIYLSCTSGPTNRYQYQVPEKSQDGIETGSLHSASIDSARVIRGINKILRGRYKQIHSILLYKDGKLVLEEYFPGHKYQWDSPKYQGEFVNWNKDMLHSIMSDTKSITSACIGIAIDKGFIGNVHQSIFDYLPDHQHLRTEGKEGITIEHMLTMTSGLAWYEWSTPYSSTENPMVGIWFSDKDPITYILEAPMAHSPGTHFTYYGGSMIVLGEIIRNATKMSIDEFAAKYLFCPIEIDSVEWSLKFDNGVIEAAGGLKMRPRDMLKIGITYLDHGMWKDKRIISEEWIENSAKPFARNTGISIPGEDTDKSGYSYSWWVNEFPVSSGSIDTFHAGGWGGQKIIVIPELETVIVFTGGDYSSKVRQFSFLENHIFPAIQK